MPWYSPSFRSDETARGLILSMVAKVVVLVTLFVNEFANEFEVQLWLTGCG